MADTRVKAAREVRGLTQAELARRARISQSLLGAIERGDSQPTIQKAHRIARVLKFQLEELWPVEFDERDEPAVGAA
jgi:transcriptional regulator with XRE-family HTH domain